MTPEHDREVAQHVLSGPLTRTRFSRGEAQALLRDWARTNPPPRFALYQLATDGVSWDGHVFAWGLGFENHLVVRSLDERLHGRFTCAETMLRTAREHGDVGMVWVD